MIGFLLLLASAVLLTVGAELFAENASAAGQRLGVTALAVGLVLAGAEPEEMVTAVFASAAHHPGIAAGDAIGANVTMLTMVLGLAALVRPLRFTGRVRGYALGASAAGAAAAIAVAGGSIGRAAGAVLSGLYVLAVAVIWRLERRPPAFGEAAELSEEHERDEGEEGNTAGRAQRDTRAALLVVAGVAGMAAGGRLAVSAATRSSRRLGCARPRSA